MILEIDSGHQSNPPHELNDPLTSFICPISDGPRADSGNTDHLSLLSQLPPSLWAKSPTDPSNPLNQCLTSKEALKGTKPIIEDYKAQDLIFPCTNPCNTPILLARKSKDHGWRSVQDLQAVNNFFFFFLKMFSGFIYLFIYFWLCWVFVAVRGLSLVAASGGYSSLRCTGFSLRWLLLLWSTGCRRGGFSSCGTWAQ